jgi:hypothetical protein
VANNIGRISETAAVSGRRCMVFVKLDGYKLLLIPSYKCRKLSSNSKQPTSSGNRSFPSSPRTPRVSVTSPSPRSHRPRTQTRPRTAPRSEGLRTHLPAGVRLRRRIASPEKGIKLPSQRLRLCREGRLAEGGEAVRGEIVGPAAVVDSKDGTLLLGRRLQRGRSTAHPGRVQWHRQGIAHEGRTPLLPHQEVGKQ